jgi:protease I
VVVASSVRGKALHDPAGGGEDIAVDLLLDEVRAAKFDALIVLGGKGVQEYLRSGRNGDKAGRLIQDMGTANKYVASLGMGTGVLADNLVLRNKRAVAMPQMAWMVRLKGAIWVDEPVVVDEPVITARDSTAARSFAAILAQHLHKTVSQSVD